MVKLPIDVMTLNDRQDLPSGSYIVEKATAAHFGGEIGQELEKLGKQGLEIGIALNKRAETLDKFNYEKEFIELQGVDNKEYETNVRGLTGMADGWWREQRAASDKRFKSWYEKLPAEAKAEYAVKSQRFIEGRSATALKDQFNQQDTHQRSVLEESNNAAGNAVQQDPETYEAYSNRQMMLIDSSALSKPEKEKLKAEVRNSLAYTSELSRAKQDPESVARRATPNFTPDVNGAIDAAAKENGIDADTLRRVAQMESGGRTGAVSPSGGHKGLFQMSETEFNKYGGGNIFSAIDNAKAAARKMKAEAGQFRKTHGRDPTATDLYMQHQQGTGGYAAHLANPEAPAWQNMLSTSEGQRKGESWAKAAIWGNIPADAKGQFPGGVETVTSSAFVSVWRRKIEGNARASAASSALTPQQSAAVQETAQRTMAAQDNQRAADYEAERTALRDQVYLELKEGPSPTTTYVEARNSGLISNIKEVERAEGIMKAREKDEKDYNAGLSLMSAGGANPYDPSHRDGIQALYDLTVKGGTDPAAAAAAIFDRTGMVPQSFANGLRGAMVSNNPNQVAAGLATTANMLRTNPNALAGISGAQEMEAGADKYRKLTESFGMSAEDAARRIMEDARDPERNSPVKKEQAQHFRSTNLKIEDVERRVSSNMGGWLSGADLPQGSQRTAISSIYSDLAMEGFERFRNPDDAMDYADREFKKQFGVQNGVVTRYPPSKVNLAAMPETGDGGFGWVYEQATRHVKDQLGIEVDKSQIVLVPLERNGISTRAAFNGNQADVKREDGTSFKSVPYMITVVPKEQGQDITTVYGAYYPDVDTYVMEKNREQARQVEPAKQGTVDPWGVPENIPAPAPEPMLTPGQKAEKARAEGETQLKESVATERTRRETSTKYTESEVTRREKSIAIYQEQISQLDLTDISGVEKRNLLAAEVTRLQGEIEEFKRRKQGVSDGL